MRPGKVAPVQGGSGARRQGSEPSRRAPPPLMRSFGIVMPAFVKRRHLVGRWPVLVRQVPADAESNRRSPVRERQAQPASKVKAIPDHGDDGSVRYALEGAVVWAALA